MLRAPQTGGRVKGYQDDDGEKSRGGVGDGQEKVCRRDTISQQNKPTAEGPTGWNHGTERYKVVRYLL